MATSDNVSSIARLRLGIDLSRDEVRAHLIAMKAIVSADGFSAPEQVAFEQRMSELNIPEDLQAETMAFDTRGVDLEKLLVGVERGSTRAKGLIYGSIGIALSDGYSAAEKAYVARVANLLGVDAKTVTALEHLAVLESEVGALRRALLA